MGESGSELFIDFSVDTGQVPGFEVVTGGGTGAASLNEAPTVLLEIVPVPVGEDCGHHWLHFSRGFCNLSLHAQNFLLSLVALDISFQGDFSAYGFNCLGVILLSDGFLDDGIQMLDCRLG